MGKLRGPGRLPAFTHPALGTSGGTLFPSVCFSPFLAVKTLSNPPQPHGAGLWPRGRDLVGRTDGVGGPASRPVGGADGGQAGCPEGLSYTAVPQPHHPPESPSPTHTPCWGRKGEPQTGTPECTVPVVLVGGAVAGRCGTVARPCRTERAAWLLMGSDGATGFCELRGLLLSPHLLKLETRLQILEDIIFVMNQLNILESLLFTHLYMNLKSV